MPRTLDTLKLLRASNERAPLKYLNSVKEYRHLVDSFFKFEEKKKKLTEIIDQFRLFLGVLLL